MSKTLLSELVPDKIDYAYVCGPAGFDRAAVDSLQGSGLSADDIYIFA